jgi:rare lipoprotein A
MVRAMLILTCPDERPVPRLGRARHGVVLSMVCAALLVGCAGGPVPSNQHAGGAPGGGGAATTGSPYRADRDGAPSDAPPDLASLPDPVPQVEPIRQGGPNKPYTVLGQSYEPVASDVPWKERGIASWYGTKFHGHKTASGELFSMYGLTAAHRTLPIPSYARVRNLSNGKEIIVRVNDRGPFHSNRVMDLSYAAAVKLGIVAQGSAQVEIERLTFDDIRTGAWKRGTVMDPDPTVAAVRPLSSAAETSTSPDAVQEDPILAAAQAHGHGATTNAAEAPSGVEPDTASPGVSPALGAEGASSAVGAIKGETARAYTPFAKGFWVQLAALGRRDGVDKLQQRVANELGNLMPMVAVFHEASYFKLQVGPYGSRSEALAAAQQAREALQISPLVVERR